MCRKYQIQFFPKKVILISFFAPPPLLFSGANYYKSFAAKLHTTCPPTYAVCEVKRNKWHIGRVV